MNFIEKHLNCTFSTLNKGVLQYVHTMVWSRKAAIYSGKSIKFHNHHVVQYYSFNTYK